MPRTNPVTEPVLFVLWYRRTKRERWAKLGRYSTRAEAVANCRGSGEFWLSELRNPELAGPTLFDDTTASDTPKP